MDGDERRAHHPHAHAAPRPGGAAGRGEDRGASTTDTRGRRRRRASTRPRPGSARRCRSPGSSTSSRTSTRARARPPKPPARLTRAAARQSRSARTPGARAPRSPRCRAGRRRPTGRRRSCGWAPTRRRRPVWPAAGQPGRRDRRRPDGLLGAAVADEFGPRLPYLLKVLAAAAPLSLQAHPDAEQAEAGFAARTPPAPDAPQTTSTVTTSRSCWSRVASSTRCAASAPPARRPRLLAALDVAALKPVVAALRDRDLAPRCAPRSSCC